MPAQQKSGDGQCLAYGVLKEQVNRFHKWEGFLLHVAEVLIVKQHFQYLLQRETHTHLSFIIFHSFPLVRVSHSPPGFSRNFSVIDFL